jgi:hypothetical protein
LNVEEASDEARVLRVEYSMSGLYGIHEVTRADVRTPLGDVRVAMSGYFAERGCYPVLIEAAMDKAWEMFCNAQA